MKRKLFLLYILSCFITFSINGQSSQPTKEELTALKKLEKIYRITPFNVSEAQLEKARDYVKSCGISSKSGITDGIPLNIKGKVDKKLLLDISTTLGSLSSSSIKSDKELCRTFIDYILSQGITEQIDFTIPTNDYSTVRNLPKGFFISLQTATDRQKGEILKFLARILEFKNVYLSEDEYLSQINADVLTNVVPPLLYLCDKPVRKRGCDKRFKSDHQISEPLYRICSRRKRYVETRRDRIPS